MVEDFEPDLLGVDFDPDFEDPDDGRAVILPVAGLGVAFSVTLSGSGSGDFSGGSLAGSMTGSSVAWGGKSSAFGSAAESVGGGRAGGTADAALADAWSPPRSKATAATATPPISRSPPRAAATMIGAALFFGITPA